MNTQLCSGPANFFAQFQSPFAELLIIFLCNFRRSLRWWLLDIRTNFSGRLNYTNCTVWVQLLFDRERHKFQRTRHDSVQQTQGGSSSVGSRRSRDKRYICMMQWLEEFSWSRSKTACTVNSNENRDILFSFWPQNSLCEFKSRASFLKFWSRLPPFFCFRVELRIVS